MPKQRYQGFLFYASKIIPYGFRRVDLLKKSNNSDSIQDYIYKLWDKMLKVVSEAYRKHLRSTDLWEGDKVQIFISGGGAAEKLVSEIFCQPWPWPGQHEKNHPVRILPVPEDYSEEENKIPFYRFAVAYGLSFPKPVLQIDDYILPKDAPDETPKEIIRSNVYKQPGDITPTKDWI